jgi:acetoin utilization protein AcuB
MTNPTIERFMTKSPHTIGHNQTLAMAHHMMTDHAIRHLPVLEAGKLVGLLSDRDLNFVETLKGVDSSQVKVADAMSVDVFTVTPATLVRQVSAEMADHKYGSAVVVDGDRVVGVFTTVDALRALATLVAPSSSNGG